MTDPSNDGWDVRRFGAVGDGNAADGESIQRAIDACGESGGGRVRIPAGAWVTATLRLRDGVGLHLDRGATLLGSTEISAYRDDLAGFVDGTGVPRGDALICAVGARDVAISGEGVIDGRGAGFHERRPMLMRFLDCVGVRVTGVTLRDSAAWVHHYLRCDDVFLHGVTVRSRCNKNNDGLNLDGCRRVRVSDCDFSSGDDALTLKSTSDRACEDIVIANCVLSSDCNGLKLGTESIGGFRNVTVSNCCVHDTRLCGLTIATVDGGDLEDVMVSNLAMRNIGAALFVRRGARCYHLPETSPERRPGILRNVTIRGLQARGVDPTGSSILGLPEAPVENVVLDDVSITSGGGGEPDDVGREVPEQPRRYPQYEQWDRLPAFGLYSRHVRGLVIRDLHCERTGPDARPAVVFDDVDDARIDGLRAPGPDDGGEAFVVMDAADAPEEWVE